MVTGWLKISRRTFAVAAAISVLIAALGIAATLMTDEPVWIAVALLVVTVIVAIMLAKGAENSRRDLLERIAEQMTAAKVATHEVPYQPGTALDLLRRDLQHDINALAFSWSRLAPAHPMPSPGGWAATPDTIAALVEAASTLAGDPTIVECGSGASTVWIALALERRGSGRVVSLEHDEAWVDVTRGRLAAVGLTHRAEVRYAPLVSAGGHPWYPSESVRDLHDIAMLFVDGPPGAVSPEARYPAFPVLRDRLRDGALVVLDDIDRAEERATLARWQAESGGRLTPIMAAQGGRAAFLRWERRQASQD